MSQGVQRPAAVAAYNIVLSGFDNADDRQPEVHLCGALHTLSESAERSTRGGWCTPMIRRTRRLIPPRVCPRDDRSG